MNRGLVFFLGVLTGMLVILGALYLSGDVSKGKLDIVKPAVTMAEKPIAFTGYNVFKVTEVLDKGAIAEAYVGAPIPLFAGPDVYLPVDGANQFYNDQLISIPEKKKAYQVGTYRYKTNGEEKIIPIIRFQ